MTRITKIKSGSSFEETFSYSRLVSVDNWIFVSNTAGRNPDTREIPDDVGEQTLQVFANIERALKGAGASLADVISARVFVQDPADSDVVMKIFSEKFRGIDPTLTATCPALGSKIYKTEIEVTAYRGASEAETERKNLSA